MKIDINENQEILLKEVFVSLLFETEDKETLSICMRDSGFEFKYNGKWYEAKNGIVKLRGT